MVPLGLLLVGAGVAAYGSPISARLPGGGRLWSSVCRTDSADSVSLTFDDGPDRATELFLQALDRAGARATFFLVGEQVAKNPGLAAEIVQAGHEVGLHGYRHCNHLLTSPGTVRGELRRARDTIESATGQPVRLFRPPYGVVSWGNWATARQLGWQTVLWSRWGRDWEKRATPQSIAARVGVPRPGDIVLLHDSDRYSAPGSWNNTLNALPLIFDAAAEQQLKITTVGANLNPLVTGD